MGDGRGLSIRALEKAWIGFLLAASLLPAHADDVQESALKADYLPRFVPFITWPDSAFASPAAPVAICVLGDNSFDGKLEQAAQEAKAGERAIVVRHMGGPDPQAACHMVFLGNGADPVTAADTLDAMRGRPVVTVTDSGLKLRGIISFVMEANHVRFDIDDAAAAQGGITISSKLLGLAHAVKQRGEP